MADEAVYLTASHSHTYLYNDLVELTIIGQNSAYGRTSSCTRLVHPEAAWQVICINYLLSNFGTKLQAGKGLFLWMDRGRENPDCKHPAESIEMGAGQGCNDVCLSIL